MMGKLSQYFPLTIVFLGVINFSETSLAQYNVPIQPPVPSHDIMFPRRDQNDGSGSSGRKYPGEYRFECEERLGIGQWKEMRDSYAFGHPKERYGDEMVKNIRRQCQSLLNP
jgi:hypothetical protein